MSEYIDVLGSIVIDNGSGVLKAGYAGDDKPKVVIQSVVGRPKEWHKRVMSGGISRERDEYIGAVVQEHRGLLKLNYPLEHGVVEDWGDMEKVWAYLYSDELNIKSEEHPVLLTEAPLNPQTNREKAAEIFFETFNIPALYVSIQAVLALYASGRTTGCVLDSGDGVTHSVPVYEGFAMSHSIQRMNLAGRDVTNYLQLLLKRQGHNFETSSEFEIVREIKEKLCAVKYDPINETEEEKKYATQEYMLPDGQKFKVGKAFYQAPEVLFRPYLTGKEYNGIHDVLVKSITKADLDLRQTLFQNVVLSGGTTVLKGFGNRLLGEVKKTMGSDNLSLPIRISAPQERKYSTWMGGSILASLNTFKKMWVSAQEYNEEGSAALHRKTFN